MMSLSFFFWLIKLVRFIQPLVKMVFGESITEKYTLERILLSGVTSYDYLKDFNTKFYNLLELYQSACVVLMLTVFKNNIYYDMAQSFTFLFPFS